MLATRYILDEDHLKYYDERLKSWASAQPVKTLPSSLYPWAQTAKAGAVSCWPVGGTQLLPTVDFLFTEVPPASGDKGPENPSVITGVSSIGLTVCQEEGVDEHSYSLSLGGTYYGGSIDLATGLMTVTWVGERLTTVTAVNAEYTDLIKFLGYTTYNNFGGDGGPSYQINNKICNLFDTFFNNSTEGCNLVYGAGNKGFGIIISNSRLSYPSNPTTQDYVDAMNTWLQSNYCFLAYRLYTPYTVQLTPPQILALSQPDKYTPRLNTVYTDASAVQVGYVKSPIREEFELQQAIVAQGGNI